MASVNFQVTMLSGSLSGHILTELGTLLISVTLDTCVCGGEMYSK